jgi:glyoxylase I family protein
MIAKTLDHIAVNVSNTQRSLDFYCGILGLKQVEQHHLQGDEVDRMNGLKGVHAQSTRLAASETPDILIDLLEFITPKSRHADAVLGDIGHTHFCLGVANLPETYRELEAKGVEFVSAPCTFDLGWGIVRVVFCKDPDGNIVELHEIPVQRKDGSTGGHAQSY